MAYYQRPRATGKKATIALVACMRKMIVIRNTMADRGETWKPPVGRAGVLAAATAAMPAAA